MDKEKQAALAARSRVGDKEAFGLLYEALIRPIFDFIYYKTHHRETAEDLTSKTFIKAYQSIQNFDAAKGTFSSWLYRIARNTVIDHYRASRSTIALEDAWDLGSGEDVAKDVEMRLRLEKVREYLKVLSAEQRDLLIMRVWQEMSYAEIAEVLGKSEASCKVAFSRLIKKLRENLPNELVMLLLLFLSSRRIF